jgi:hypothetical protein
MSAANRGGTRDPNGNLSIPQAALPAIFARVPHGEDVSTLAGRRFACQQKRRDGVGQRAGNDNFESMSIRQGVMQSRDLFSLGVNNKPGARTASSVRA